MRGTVGFGTFATGMVGIMVGSRCERGWDNWNRTQRIVCSVSAAVGLVGLFLMG
ncbi:hypothetical protein [Streptomyces sp. NPDC001389]|uniref:hypothetical protein n=1 Tax=unclassified Streptomyces TaxID=2593676 RepID=UPI0036AE6AB8